MTTLLYEGQPTTFEELNDFFHSVSKAEYHLYLLTNKDKNAYLKLKHEALSLPEEDFLDGVIFDCSFVEEPRLIRHVLHTVDLTKTDSSFAHAKRSIEGHRLRYWRDFLKGEIEVEPDKYLTYLNFFTRFAARTGKGVDVKMLSDLEYLEGQFLRERMLAKSLTFNSDKVSKTYTLHFIRTGDIEKLALEKSNAFWTDKVNALQGGDTDAN